MRVFGKQWHIDVKYKVYGTPKNIKFPAETQKIMV
jgi:hypothetical protein